jgi:scyllo-inositol 2-dehydrogenase (NADP+)
LPSFLVHGTKGSYQKDRTDVQEEQLVGGLSPLSDLYGIEDGKRKGVLTVMDESGAKNIVQEDIKGNYMGFFEAVYKQIRFGDDFPVKEEDIICQLQLLEMPGL